MADDERSSQTYYEILKRKIESLQEEATRLVSCDEPVLAVKKLTRALALDPRNPDLYKQRGEVFYKLKDYPSAIDNISKALRVSPSANKKDIQERLAVVFGCYGDQLYQDCQYKLALENYLKASEWLPKFRTNCISCYFHLQDYQQAMSMLNIELDQSSPTAQLFIMRAQLHHRFGNASECYHDVEAALELNPTSQDALNIKSQLEQNTSIAKKQAMEYCLVGKLKEAIRKISMAIDSDPHNAEHHILRGSLYRQSHLYNEAVDDFLQAMDKCGHCYEHATYQEASKQLILTYNDFAIQCFRHGQYSDAIVLLNKAIKEEKKEASLYVNRGDCYFKLGDYDFALADYQQAYDTEVTLGASIKYRLAVVHSKIGMKKFADKSLISAEEHFTAAITSSPFTARFYICRARTRSDLKNLSDARTDVLTALILAPNSEENLPLIAHLFPGNSIQELLSCDESYQVRQSLASKSKGSCDDSSPTETLNNTDKTIENIEYLLVTLKFLDDVSEDETESHLKL